MTGWRRSLPLVVWLAALVVGVGGFHALGAGALAPPPLTDPGAWPDWLQAREATVAAVALLRLLVLALAWYLLGVTTVGLLARLLRAARLERAADAVTIPAVRRLLQGALGVGLATAMVGAATAPVPRPATDPTAGAPTAEATALDAVAVGDGHLDLVDAPASGVGDAPVGARPPAAGAGAARPDDGPAAPRVLGERDAPVALRLLEEDEAEEDEAEEPPADERPVLRRAEEKTAAAGRPPRERARGSGTVGDGLPPALDAARDLEATGADTATGAGPAPRGAGPTTVEAEGSEPAAGPEPEPMAGGTHRVRAGESLWSISQDGLADAWGREPTDAEVYAHWQRLIEDNRDRLPDPENPDLLFPGDEVAVPPPPADGA